MAAGLELIQRCATSFLRMSKAWDEGPQERLRAALIGMSSSIGVLNNAKDNLLSGHVCVACRRVDRVRSCAGRRRRGRRRWSGRRRCGRQRRSWRNQRRLGERNERRGGWNRGGQCWRRHWDGIQRRYQQWQWRGYRPGRPSDHPSRRLQRSNPKVTTSSPGDFKNGKLRVQLSSFPTASVAQRARPRWYGLFMD